MNLLLALALCVMSTSQTGLGCMDPDQFIKSSDHKNPFDHISLFRQGTALKEGEFGYIKGIGRSFGMMAKGVAKPKDYKDYSLGKEIASIKIICGQDELKTYYWGAPCESKEIPMLFGCVEDDRSVYIFQEGMDGDFGQNHAVSLYTELSTLEKIDVMLQIISKFKRIHELGIVHGNIAPKHLATKEGNLADIRILDFRKSGNEGMEVIHEPSCFAAPEHSLKGHLSFKGDIFSLAMTFAAMEGLIYNYFLSEVREDKKGNCGKEWMKEVRGAFNKDNGTELLKSIMLKALDEDPANRYESMADFGAAIQAVRDQLSPPNPQSQGWTWNYFKGLVGLGSGDGRRVLTLEAGSQVSHPKGRGLGAQQEDRVIL